MTFAEKIEAQGRQKGRQEGIQEGIQKGKQEAAETIVLNLLREGAETAFIAKVTQWPVTDIERLRATVNGAK